MGSDGLFERVLVRPPTADLRRCVSGNPLRDTLDVERALEQHRAYVAALEEHGIEVLKLPPLEGFPDAVFVQDTAIIAARSGKALLARFGEPSRRGEEESVGTFLAQLGFQVERVEEPGTLEGGDVLVTDLGLVLVGLSRRTNEAGAKQLAAWLPEGVRLVEVPVLEDLHLLSVLSYLGRGRLAFVPGRVGAEFLRALRADIELVPVPPEEAYAANMLYLGDDVVLMPAGHPRTREQLVRAGLRPVEVNVSEFWKCDGGITCLCAPFYRL